MKYKIKIILIIIIFFLLAQLIGLYVTYSYKENFYKEEVKKEEKKNESKKINITNISKGEKNISLTREIIPEKIEIKTKIDIIQILISFIIAIVIATFIFIMLMKVGIIKILKFWFFLVFLIGLFISFSLILMNLLKESLIIDGINIKIVEIVAFILAFSIAYFKAYKNNIIIHNLSEIFIYPGIVILFLPLVNIYITLILLLVISIYDIIAVFKTKHMQKMAEFMIKDLKTFTGFFMPWIDKKDREKIKKIKEKNKKIKIKVNIAALGGGDIALPMLFITNVFLISNIIKALIVLLFATIGLSLLLIFGKKGKAYPALPPLTIGCIIGYIISLFI